MIEKTYEALVKNLEDLIKAHRLLLDLVNKEKDILVASNIEELSEANKAKEVILLKITELEKARKEIINTLSEQTGRDLFGLKLIEVARIFDLPKEKRLSEIHGVLKLLIEQIREVNQSNEALTQSALKSVNGALDSFKDSVHGKATYGKSGSKKIRPTTSGAFVSKEV